MVPDLNDVPETPETGFSGVSLVGKTNANEGLVSLVGGSQPPKLTDEELTRRVDKFSFALGKTFSREDISRYLTTGSEEQLRKLAAAHKDIEDEAHRTATLKDILSSGMPAEPDQQQALLANVKTLGAFKPANDPSTIVEEAYAKNFTQSVPSVGPKDNALLRLEQEATDKALYNQSRERVEKAQDTLLSAEEKAERIKLYQENAKDVLEKAEQTYSKESLFGKIIDFGKSAVPFADYYNMSMDVPGMEAVGLLPGTSIAQWVTKLYDQPPAVQKQWLNTAVETIGSYNPALAVRVAEAAVSYTTTDKYLDNVFGVLDLSDAGDVARLAKTAGLAAISLRQGAKSFRKGLEQGEKVVATAAKEAAVSPVVENFDFDKYVGAIGPKVEEAMRRAANAGRYPDQHVSVVLERMSNDVSQAMRAAEKAAEGDPERLNGILQAMGEKVSRAMNKALETQLPYPETKTLKEVGERTRKTAPAISVDEIIPKTEPDIPSVEEFEKMAAEARKDLVRANSVLVRLTKREKREGVDLSEEKADVRAWIAQAKKGLQDLETDRHLKRLAEVRVALPGSRSAQVMQEAHRQQLVQDVKDALAKAAEDEAERLEQKRAAKDTRVKTATELKESWGKPSGKPEEPSEAVNAYKAAIRADADPRRDPAAFKAAMGDINGAAAQNVLSKSPGKLQNPVETSSATPTVFNTKANPGSSDGLAGAQTGRLWAYIRDRASRFQEKVDAAIRVNRLPEEALQAAFEGTDAEFRQAIAQSLNNAIQNVRREVPLSAAEQKLDRYLAERGANMSRVPRVEPDAILRPEQIPLDDPMREQLIKHYERKQAAKDERDETLRQLAKEGSVKVEPPAEAPKAPEPTIKGTPVRPEHASENLGRWEYEITKPDGETFSGRHWEKEMTFWARQMGMEVGDYGARQTGNGWVMTVTVPIDETKPYVRAALKTNKNGTNPIAPLMGLWRRGGGRVSEFSSNNRIAYVVGQEKLREVIEPLARPLLNLDKDQIKDLNRVMSEEMNRIDPSNDLPGYFYEDMAEFESAYRRLNGRSPSAKESDAYLSARTLYDLEYGMRSHSYHKELARLGLKTVTLPITKVDPKTGMKSFSKTSFEGKVIDRIPLDARDAKERAMVAIYHEGEEPKILPLNALATEGRQGRIEEMQKQGYKIIQTGNAPRKPGKEIFGEDESINFIITKDAHFSPLGTSLGRREGWHQIYPQKFFVKQPVVRRVEKDGLVHHYYEGEVVWAGFHTEAEARKFEKAMETARRIAFEGAPGDLEQHLAEHLPYKEKQFRKLFEDTVKKDGTVTPAYFSKTEPFLSLSDGSISMDAYKELMESRYANLYDTIRSPWNIMNQVDKKFVGHRDELLHTIKEGKGSQGNPVFNLTRAEILDPLSAMSDGITNMIRNHHMIDLRLQFGESWVNEFKHLFNKNEQALYNDLVNTIMNPPWIPNVQNIAHDEYLKAENARLAFLELLNLETPFQASMENLKSKLLDQVYTRLGQNYSDGLATSRLMQTRHPLAFLRGIVFHTGVGMFNPMPAIQNVAQIANAIAISPKHGLAAAGFSIYAHLTRLNGNPKIVRELGKLAQKATGGAYKAEWFEEGIELLKDSGYWNVGGSHSFADHLNDPKLTATKWTGKVLDAGSVLFTETEKQLRTTAFFTSFLEHKVANPTKAINAIDLNELLARANTLAGRMTRDQKARWQSGEIMSTWGQFFSYNARLMEMVLERGFGRKDTLTVPERLRLLGMNTLLYGVPVGLAGSLVGGFVNPYDHIKKAFVDNQIDVDDGWVEKFMDGVVGHMSKALTGVNVSPALGPTGRDLFKSLEQDFGWFRFVMGASGGKIVDVYKSTDHLMASTWLALNGKISPKAAGRDLLDIFRNVATIDKTTKMYLALLNHNLYTREGQQINPLDEPVDPIAGIVSAITGQLPSDYDYAMYEKKIMDEMPQIIRQLGKQAQHDYRLMLQATADQDYDTAAFYANRITYWTKGIPEREEAEKILHEAMKRDKPLVDQIREHKTHHWTDVSESWKKAFGKYFSNVNPTND